MPTEIYLYLDGAALKKICGAAETIEVGNSNPPHQPTRNPTDLFYFVFVFFLFLFHIRIFLVIVASWRPNLSDPWNCIQAWWKFSEKKIVTKPKSQKKKEMFACRWEWSLSIYKRQISTKDDGFLFIFISPKKKYITRCGKYPIVLYRFRPKQINAAYI